MTSLDRFFQKEVIEETGKLKEKEDFFTILLLTAVVDLRLPQPCRHWLVAAVLTSSVGPASQTGHSQLAVPSIAFRGCSSRQGVLQWSGSQPSAVTAVSIRPCLATLPIPWGPPARAGSDLLWSLTLH